MTKRNLIFVITYLILSITAGLLFAAWLQNILNFYEFYETLFLCFVCIIIFALLLLPFLDKFVD